MNVYIWTSGSLKNAYIGEYKGWHYDYTFKWKTAAEIWNEWTTQVWSIAVDTNWITWIGSNGDVIISKDIPSLATAKRIITSWTATVNQN
jgi:hypothetical protein